MKSSSDDKSNDKGDNKEKMCLEEIAKINENINKTRVEGLQTLHVVS